MDAQSNIVPSNPRRPPTTQEEFDSKFRNVSRSLNRRFTNRYFGAGRTHARAEPSPLQESTVEQAQSFPFTIKQHVPILAWLPEYNTIENLFGDLFGGAAVGLLSVAEGFAFSFVAGLPLVNGLYASVIASLVYAIFGTSPHIFLGGNAVICLMIRTAIERVSTPYDYLYTLSEENTKTRLLLEGDEQSEAAGTLAFMVAIIQILLILFRADAVVSLVSQHVLAGFSLGAAIRILILQMKYILPLSVEDCLGPYTCLKSTIDCFGFLNQYTLAVSVIVLLFIILTRKVLNPLMQAKLSTSIPIEFLAIACASALAYFVSAGDDYSISVVEHEQLSVAVVGLLSSIFGAYPCAQSAYRTNIGIAAGAKTILSCAISCVITVVAVVFAQHLIEAEPLCVLSCIVIATLGEHFSEVKHLADLWHVSKLDVPLVNVSSSGTYYVESKYYGGEYTEECGYAVVRQQGPLLFYNARQFENEAIQIANDIKGQLLGAGIGTRSGSMKSTNAAAITGAKNAPKQTTLLVSGDIAPLGDNATLDQQWSKALVLDFSAVTAIDASGAEAMIRLFRRFEIQKIRMLIACAQYKVRRTFKAAQGFEVIPKRLFFPSVQDSVLYTQQLCGTLPANIHTSISLNGYRDLITLSTATSNLDLDNWRKMTVDVPMAESSSVARLPSRRSLPDSRCSPIPTVRTCNVDDQ
ncbi:SULP-4 protein [Aphelenchoides avenae]|nr:SULP-4 protein [Aphelenchus avenae]